ncbi:hypothetical protein [Amycolatopsis sp. PS_44_ISF1]|uniref:hypothetical protein n=1 Tax=Amycolatopsis sp. PS_44_ISF1 TaxID=2974917 RepID=UPI0028DE71BB|nr:hypothetical protein [Amycolatopsis sp. PS_44_ISF1]MDT8916243.1 hypothetical protein [Amycolatopsis sp. PS_44_ISF1]
MAREPMTKTVRTESEADAWLDWVAKHHGLAGASLSQVAGGFRVEARLPDPGDVTISCPEGL